MEERRAVASERYRILSFFSAPSGKVRKLRRNSDLTPSLGHLQDWTSQAAPTRA